MSLVAADYGSSSDEEDKPLVNKEIRGKKRKKKISLLCLPEEIRSALEMRQDSDEEDAFTSKQRRKKQRESVRTVESASFLPKPKHQLEIRLETAPETTRETILKETTASSVASHEKMPQLSESDRHEKPENKRDRRRQLERALHSGKFDEIPGQVKEIHGVAPDTWQPVARDKLHELQGDSRISAQSWVTSTDSGIYSELRPSRLQRKRHQLNQLAFDAKAQEVELMEMRGTGLKTRRETQAKYGW